MLTYTGIANLMGGFAGPAVKRGSFFNDYD
jgi:hypothetical protein